MPVPSRIAILAPLAASVLMAAPASAHDSLTGSNPVTGAVVTTAAPAIHLAFTGAVANKPAAPHIQVVGPAGKHYETACATAEHNTANVLWKPGPQGAYTVTWRVVSDDGHPASGSYMFTYAGRPGPLPATAPKCDDASSNSPRAGVIMLALAICLASAGGVAALIYRERRPTRPLGYYEDDDEV